MAGEIEIRWARGPEDVAAAFRVREQVFCVEQGVPREEELDGLDEQALHLLAFERDEPASAAGSREQAEGERPIGTLRLLLAGEQAKIGRVAVEADRRRRGLASQMLEQALARARDSGARRARLAAQVVAVALYERAGFAVESEPFDDAGIAHVWMGRSLVPPAPHA
ncbi:MAG TPA: GNAT family N-acetyltransferase [Solirubrobacteraceae bacterium]|nr:GNAT family N-acetyltransferase [Solirubrobacteraceae bacterium]